MAGRGLGETLRRRPGMWFPAGLSLMTLAMAREAVVAPNQEVLCAVPMPRTPRTPLTRPSFQPKLGRADRRQWR